MTQSIEMANRPRAIALDLGSTRFKAGLLDDAGRLSAIHSIAAPALRGRGLIREGDPGKFLDAANELLDVVADRLAGRQAGIPLGLVCQRSTFTIWDRTSGETLVPMISWQDRRAADWCARHSSSGASVAARAGLLLSPHYVGSKVAAEQENDPTLSAALEKGQAMIGTLDAWLVWHWTHARIFQTDLTMAARTGLADIERAAWCSELLDLFNVPVNALPDIRSTSGHDICVRHGLRLMASIADQASGALAVLAPNENMALVNFGTGAFVLYPIADAGIRRPGYLTAPIDARDHRKARFVLEGTINGAGPALDHFASGPTELPPVDPCPDGFAIPDQTGLGSPYWRADLGLTLSDAATDLPAEDQRRIVLEGLLFRVLEILVELSAAELPDRVVVSGGLVRDPSIGLGLAQLLGRAIERLDEPETTLLGAARLAAGLDPFAHPATSLIEATDAGAYLRGKYPRWQAWMCDRIN